jgi:hypothetical protein
MRTKQAIIAFIMLLFLSSFTQIQAKEPNGPPVQLLDIIRVMDEKNISVDRWSLYTKKKGRLLDNENGYEKTASSLKNQLPLFEWTEIKKEPNHIEVTGTRLDKGTDIMERLTLVAYPQNKHLRTYYIYEVEGKQWHKGDWNRFSESFSNRMNAFFKNNPTIYSCVEGRLSGTINFVLLQKASDILQSFSAVPIEQLKEKTFVSVSAYTNEWKTSIQTNEQEMNLQVALRAGQPDGAVTVTIGTPIITSEY